MDKYKILQTSNNALFDGFYNSKQLSGGVI